MNSRSLIALKMIKAGLIRSIDETDYLVRKQIKEYKKRNIKVEENTDNKKDILNHDYGDKLNDFINLISFQKEIVSFPEFKGVNVLINAIKEDGIDEFTKEIANQLELPYVEIEIHLGESIRNSLVRAYSKLLDQNSDVNVVRRGIIVIKNIEQINVLTSWGCDMATYLIRLFNGLDIEVDYGEEKLKFNTSKNMIVNFGYFRVNDDMLNSDIEIKKENDTIKSIVDIRNIKHFMELVKFIDLEVDNKLEDKSENVIKLLRKENKND